jgi:hypothetical protein
VAVEDKADIKKGGGLGEVIVVTVNLYFGLILLSPK